MILILWYDIWLDYHYQSPSHVVLLMTKKMHGAPLNLTRQIGHVIKIYYILYYYIESFQSVLVRSSCSCSSGFGCNLSDIDFDSIWFDWFEMLWYDFIIILWVRYVSTGYDSMIWYDMIQWYDMLLINCPGVVIWFWIWWIEMSAILSWFWKVWFDMVRFDSCLVRIWVFVRPDALSAGDMVSGFDASGGFSGHLSMSDLHLLEEADEAAPQEQEQICPVCLTSSQARHPFKPGYVTFVKSNKDEFCHTCHLLLHGEMSWKDSHLLRFSDCGCAKHQHVRPLGPVCFFLFFFPSSHYQSATHQYRGFESIGGNDSRMIWYDMIHIWYDLALVRYVRYGMIRYDLIWFQIKSNQEWIIISY